MHQFYFAIQSESQRPDDQAKRVTRIQSAASSHGLTCHSETYGDTTTIQVETDDDEIALVFKLAAESALYEDHPPKS